MEELLIEMLRYYGLKEVVGPDSNPKILKFFKDIGYNWVEDDSVAWCSAALNYFCKKLGYERSHALDARSWLKVGIQIFSPKIGDIVIFWRESKDSWKGHVGLYISEENGVIYTLGGNQGNALNITPYNKARLLGYRRLRKL